MSNSVYQTPPNLKIVPIRGAGAKRKPVTLITHHSLTHHSPKSQQLCNTEKRLFDGGRAVPYTQEVQNAASRLSDSWQRFRNLLGLEPGSLCRLEDRVFMEVRLGFSKL